MDLLPAIFTDMLVRLKRPIPNVPVSGEPPTVSYSSSSLAAALGDTPSKVPTSTTMQQLHATTQPPEDDIVVLDEAPDVLPETHVPQPCDPAHTPNPRNQVTGNASGASTNLSSSPSITLTNPPYPTTANRDTSIPNDATRRAYRPVDYKQIALVPRRNFSNAIPNTIRGEVSQPQLSAWASRPLPETLTPALPRQPPARIRLPRQADRSRLTKDILKQLGKPSGFVPVVPTRREYEGQRKTRPNAEDALAQPSTEPVVAGPQPMMMHDDPPSPQEIVPISDQVPSPGSSANPPLETRANEPPLLEYPDPVAGPTPHDADATDEDSNKDGHIPNGPLVTQPPTSSRSDLPQESVSSLVAPESATDKEEPSATDQLLVSKLQSSKRSGPPPDADIIEISDDEELTTIDATTSAVEPMEVDEGVVAGGAVSRSLSGLSLDGENTLVAGKPEKDRNEEPLSGRSSQEPNDREGTRSTERRPQRFQPFLVIPPLPDYARQHKGKESAPTEEKEEEGSCEAPIPWV